MIETHSEMRPGTWRVPECPLLIEYSPAVLEEIRLAGVDAFFSLPRGGAEIGGVLYGRHDRTLVRIESFQPMACEHAMGPTFVLSPNDKAKLRTQLEDSAHDPLLRGMEIVGWYHTHTRSEIFLSALDLEIYREYFPQQWQVALVLRPSGMKPTRAGFFFRDRQSNVHSSASYSEFVVVPDSEGFGSGTGRLQAVPAPVPRRTAEHAPRPEPAPALPAPDPEEEVKALLPAAAGPLQRVELPPANLITEPAPSLETRQTEFVPPAFMLPPERRPFPTRLLVGLGLVAALGVGAYFTSPYWASVFVSKPLNLHLQAQDTNGQLRIQWDREAMTSADVRGGSLDIQDGSSATSVAMDAVKLRMGSFQYVRRSDIVEIHLTVRTSRGPLEEFTSFYGQPQRAGAGAGSHPGAVEQQKQTSALAAEAEKARGDLKKQELRALEAERALEQMRQIVRRDEERRRVENQMPAGRPSQPVEAQPSARPSAPATQNATPQEKPQGVVQTVVPQASRPAPPASDKPPAAKERAPAAAPPPPQSQSANRQAVVAQPTLSGKWVFSPASKSGSAYPPESITLMLVDTGNQITGTFTGRYKVPKNGKINPRVNFSFEGPSQPGSSKFNFTAANGMKGHVELIRLPAKQNAIEVVWYSERDKLTFDDIFFRVP